MAEWLDELAVQALQAVQQGNAGALLALFVLVTLTEFGLPFPFVIDSLLIALGYSTGRLWLQIFVVFFVLFAGRAIGSSVVYALARYPGTSIFGWVVSRLPWLTVMGRHTRAWFSRRALVKRYGPRLAATLSRALPARRGLEASIAVMITRFTPGLLTAAPLAAGSMRMHYGYFLIGVAMESFVADFLLVLLGLLMSQILVRMGIFLRPWMIILISIALAAVLAALATLVRRRWPPAKG